MPRARDSDACPGALQVHQAADGALVRVRLPGGMMTAAQLSTLARVATEFGSGTLELTARGNVQLRGIADSPRLPKPSPPPGCCRRRRMSGRATSSPRRCPAGPADAPTCGRGWVSWTRRFAPNRARGAGRPVLVQPRRRPRRRVRPARRCRRARLGRRRCGAGVGGSRHRRSAGRRRRGRATGRHRRALHRDARKGLACKRIG